MASSIGRINIYYFDCEARSYVHSVHFCSTEQVMKAMNDLITFCRNVLIRDVKFYAKM